ncbi:MAG TPA: F0F1 ATP synthase subunit B', partial [Rhizobiales bacterium]|nr:F0F1 ATP synthase subunit B' [Hyphomicrobiales bacterium]
MPQLDTSTFMPQLVWLAITFFVLYVIMTRLALPRIGGAIEQRQD